MWHKVEPHHWQNHNDKHLIWDKEAKTLSTEDWSKSPISVVVIPMHILEKFFPENRYYIIPEAQYLAEERRVSAKLEHNSELLDLSEKLEHKLKLTQARAQEVSSLASLAHHSFEQALKIVESDSKEISQLKKTISDLQAHNVKVFQLAQKEIQRLKEKCGE